MFYQLKSSHFFVGIVFLVSFISPAVAHNVKTNANVGATFHIEPNHNPRAKETSTAWFALTHKGGKLIPLSECNCQLVVYDQSDTTGNSPILTPSLKAISVEKYQDIPGAEIIFPEAGIYELTLSGSPKASEDFHPFKLTYTVTVTPAIAKSDPTTMVRVTPETSNPVAIAPSSTWQWLIPVSVLAAIIGITGIWFGRKIAQSKNK
jgi:hypothetical protein